MFNLIYGSKPSRFYCWHWTSHRQQLQLGMSWRQLTIRSRRVHWLGRDQPKGKSQKRNRILDLHFLMASNMSPRGRWSSRWVCSFSLKRSSATFRPYEIQQRTWQNLICSSAKAQMRIQQSMIASSLKNDLLRKEFPLCIWICSRSAKGVLTLDCTYVYWRNVIEKPFSVHIHCFSPQRIICTLAACTLAAWRICLAHFLCTNFLSHEQFTS